MHPVALILPVALAAAAAACDVCSGREVFEEATHTVALPAGGDWADCNCDFVFSYSTGSPGRVRIDATPGLDVTIYDSVQLTATPVAEFAAADLLQGATVFSQTGILRVAVATDAAPVAGAAISMTASAINQAPIITEQDGLIRESLFAVLLLPWGTAALPFTVDDPDNNDLGMVADLELAAEPVRGTPLASFIVPATPGVTFDQGAPDTLVRRVVLSGPGSAVSAALAATQIVTEVLDTFFVDTLTFVVSDLGNSGEGSGPLTSSYSTDLWPFASGTVDVPRGVQMLNSGVPPDDGSYAVFYVHEAAQIQFTQLFLIPLDDACRSFMRVWDGPNRDVGRLLSTDLSLTGEICGENALLPTYVSTSGEFVVEYSVVARGERFDTVVTPSPAVFRVWTLDELATVAVIDGDPVLLPRILVSTLPDESQIAVNISAAFGSVTLRFADSFVDLIVGADDSGPLQLAVESSAGVPAMIRMGDALRELLYVPPTGTETGLDVITIRASSGGQDAVMLEFEVILAPVAINAPSSLDLHAFQPVPIEITVSGTSEVTVSVDSDIGLLSVDPRAALWMDVGYASSMTVPTSALGNLVYRASLGGTDAIVVAADDVQRTIDVVVDPECSGGHTVYGRSVVVTERAGPPSDTHSGDLACAFSVIGGRTITFPFFEAFPPRVFFLADGEDNLVFAATFRPPGDYVSTEVQPQFDIDYDANNVRGAGFVAVLDEFEGFNDPPVIVVPGDGFKVVRGSVTPLNMLYVDDFSESLVSATLETSAGSLITEGEQLVEIAEATFAELDTRLTSIDFLAGDEQVTATLVLSATDSDGAQMSETFTIEVLPCEGTVDITVVDDGHAIVTDGSDTADYVGRLSCAWRVTGAPAPAVLSVQYLDLDCAGDRVTVYDGASAAGRLLGEFCQSRDIEASGELISSTGSFFVALTTDATQEDDGFSFRYSGISAGSTTTLGTAPSEADPQRTNATVLALDASTVVVFGGHNGVRPVGTTLVFQIGAGWRVLAGDGPSGRSQAAGAALSATQFVVHGGVGVDNRIGDETWLADLDVDASTIAWTLLPASGPATAAAAMHGALLLDPEGVFRLEGDRWSRLADTPATVVPTSSAHDGASGTHIYAAAADGQIWSLSTADAVWTRLDASLPLACEPWSCSGAMLGPDEYVIGEHRINVTTAEVGVLPSAPPSGQAVGGSLVGQPAMFVYGAGAMSAVALTLAVDGHTPLVSPNVGGTVVQVAGERLSACADPRCRFGDDVEVPLEVMSDRVGRCETPAAGAAVTTLALVCDEGRAFATPLSIWFFDAPTIAGVTPAVPEPGATLVIELEGVSEEVLAAAADTALCRFDGGLPTEASVDGTQLLCLVPETVGTTRQAGAASEDGAAVTTLEVSLDGQQYSTSTRLDLVAESSSGGGDTSMPIIIGVACGAAGILLVLALVTMRYKRLAAARVDTGPAPWEIAFDSIELAQVIGAGGYGNVYVGMYRGGQVAVKMIKGDMGDVAIEAFRKESALMAELRHPNIVLFMGACTEPPDIAIVLEFLPNGSLFDLLHDDAFIIRAAERVSFALDIVRGMAYLHSAEPPIVHRDLKSLNVLVDKNFVLKVSDFGLTEIFENQTPAQKQKLQSNPDPQERDLGSVQWTAPEVLRGKAGDTASDVYSFGITLWEICTREVPYIGFPVAAVAARVSADPNYRPPISRSEIGAPFNSIIRECWATDPESRPTFSGLQRRLSNFKPDPTSDGSSGPPSARPSGSTSSLMFSGNMTGDCVVVLRVANAPDQWDVDPTAMREGLDTLQTTCVDQAMRMRGEALLDNPEVPQCIFTAAADGVAFVAAIQMALASRTPQLVIAGGLAIGHSAFVTDQTTRRRVAEGPGFVEAAEFAQRCPGGRVLTRHSVIANVDLAALGLVTEVVDPESDTVLLFTEALRRLTAANAAIEEAAKAAVAATAGPSWMIDVDELEVGDLIGAGSFGTVFRATWRGAPVVCKQLHRKKLGAKESLDLMMEGGIASKLRHPNVCQVLGVCKDVDRVFVVSEVMPRGSVFEAVVSSRKREIGARIKVGIARDVALGLRYLHEQNPPIVHRSLTARNVLLAKDWQARVSDFGLARTKNSAVTMTKVGTTAYSAPELLEGGRYDEKVDVYAYAVLLWEVAEQRPVFGGLPMRTVMATVLGGERPEVKLGWRADNSLGDAYVDAMEECWRASPSERPAMAEVVSRF